MGVAALAAAMLSGCVQPPPAPPPSAGLEAVPFDQIPGWQTDHLAESFAALRAECRRFGVLPPDTLLGGQGLAATYGGKAGQWSAPCLLAASVIANDDAGVRRFYEARFQPYRLSAPGLFTGYYEPEVQGAREEGAGYMVPLLARPKDLVQGPPPAEDPKAPPTVGRSVAGKLVPYFTRAEIEAGAMGGAAHPLLWLRDPVDLFFLQVQGSGRVRLPDGSVVRIGYDGKNGRPYTPIGRVLLQRNALGSADINMQGIRWWLAGHPGDVKAVLDQNEDYVFFRLLPDTDVFEGPPGALGVNLVARRSAAVDPHFTPLGAPVFLDTTDPVGGTAWRHLLLAQDSGTDIKGPARTDIFFGFGPLAEQQAGRMRQTGTEYLLLPRPAK